MTKGPPFTVARYGSLGASIIAERDWLKEENEQLRTALTKAHKLLIRGLPILALAEIRSHAPDAEKL